MKDRDAKPEHHRAVRSYVLRAGRLTDGQKRALDDLLPRYGVPDDGRPIDFRALFGNDLPVILEIGFGNGDATWQMARAHPEQNFLGVEVHPPGIGHLLLKLDEHGLDNVRVAQADAVELLRDRVPQASLAGVRIFFPDPWPKKRHHKRRLVQPAFVALVTSRLEAGGVLHLATDWRPYADHMLEVLEAEPRLENLAGPGRCSDPPGWRPQTRFERRGRRLGHEVCDLLYRRRP